MVYYFAELPQVTPGPQLIGWESRAKDDKLEISPQGNWKSEARREKSLAAGCWWNSLGVRALLNLMGSWLDHQWESLESWQEAAYRSVAKQAWGNQRGHPQNLLRLTPSLALPHTDPALQVQEQKAKENQEEKPIFPPESLQHPLLERFNIVC